MIFMEVKEVKVPPAPEATAEEVSSLCSLGEVKGQ